MLVCSYGNSSDTGRNLKYASPFCASISSVTSEGLSYTFIISIPNKEILAFMGSPNRSEMYQVAGDLTVASLLLSLHTIVCTVCNASKNWSSPYDIKIAGLVMKSMGLPTIAIN